MSSARRPQGRGGSRVTIAWRFPSSHSMPSAGDATGGEQPDSDPEETSRKGDRGVRIMRPVRHEELGRGRRGFDAEDSARDVGRVSGREVAYERRRTGRTRTDGRANHRQHPWAGREEQPSETHRGEPDGQRASQRVARRPEGLRPGPPTAPPEPTCIARAQPEVSCTRWDGGPRQGHGQGDQVRVQGRASSAQLEHRRPPSAAVDRLGDEQSIVSGVCGQLSHGTAPCARTGCRAGRACRGGCGTSRFRARPRSAPRSRCSRSPRCRRGRWPPAGRQ